MSAKHEIKDGSKHERKRAEARRCTEVLRDLTVIFRSRFEEEFSDTGVTLPQLRLLNAVRDGAELSAASIARLCHVTPQTLHAMLSRAVREGWITRGSTDRNHRFVTASLTPAGEALLGRGTALKETTEAELWQDVPLDELRRVRKTLETGLANLRRPAATPEK